MLLFFLVDYTCIFSGSHSSMKHYCLIAFIFANGTSITIYAKSGILLSRVVTSMLH